MQIRLPNREHGVFQGIPACSPMILWYVLTNDAQYLCGALFFVAEAAFLALAIEEVYFFLYFASPRYKE